MLFGIVAKNEKAKAERIGFPIGWGSGADAE